MGFHLTNILLHAAAALSVFIFVFYVSDNIGASFLTGLLFAVHPIHTEAVAYIAGRADSLYSIFFLLSFIFFKRNARGSIPASAARISICDSLAKVLVLLPGARQAPVLNG